MSYIGPVDRDLQLLLEITTHDEPRTAVLLPESARNKLRQAPSVSIVEVTAFKLLQSAKSYWLEIGSLTTYKNIQLGQEGWGVQLGLFGVTPNDVCLAADGQGALTIHVEDGPAEKGLLSEFDRRITAALPAGQVVVGLTAQEYDGAFAPVYDVRIPLRQNLPSAG